MEGDTRPRDRARPSSSPQGSGSGPAQASEDADEVPRPPTAGVHDERYGKVLFKTRMCSYFQAGHCVRRVCRFAHSEDELRHPPDWSKTVLCHFIRDRGYCRMENCKYAHHTSELREDGYGFDKSKGCFKTKKHRKPDPAQGQGSGASMAEEGRAHPPASASASACAPASVSGSGLASSAHPVPMPTAAADVVEWSSQGKSCSDLESMTGDLPAFPAARAGGSAAGPPSPWCPPLRKVGAPLKPGLVEPAAGTSLAEAFPPVSSTNSGLSSFLVPPTSSANSGVSFLLPPTSSTNSGLDAGPYPRAADYFEDEQWFTESTSEREFAGEPAVPALPAGEVLVSPKSSLGAEAGRAATEASSSLHHGELDEVCSSRQPSVRSSGNLTSMLLNFGLPPAPVVSAPTEAFTAKENSLTSF